MSTETKTSSDMLNEASLNLLHVRSVLDLLHTSVCCSGGAMIEQVDTKSWSGIFDAMLYKVDEAKKLIDQSFSAPEESSVTQEMRS